MSSSNTSSFKRQIPSQCDCAKPLKMHTSWTSSNLGRRFFVFPNSMKKGKKCNAFYWFDSELHNKKYRETMYAIYNMLNQENMQEITRHDETEKSLHILEAEFDLYKSKTTTRHVVFAIRIEEIRRKC